MADKDFSKLQKNLQRLHSRLGKGYAHFYIWEALIISTDPSKNTKEEFEQNLEIMNKFNGFFVPTIESHRISFILELAKIFDHHEKALSINKVKKHASKNAEKFTKEEFQDFNTDRKYIKELSENYKGLEVDDLRKIKKTLKENATKIEDLKRHRNQSLAHDDEEKEAVNASVQDAKDLFKIASEILNILSSKTNHESWSHFSMGETAERDTKNVVKYLGNYEPLRREKLQEKYKKLKNG